MYRQTKKRKAVNSRKIDADTTSIHTDYSHRLNFYTQPPTEELTLEQFELWAIDRLKLLLELESLELRTRGKSDDSTGPQFRALADRHMPLSLDLGSRNPDLVAAERRKDHYSHFILRLAFCRNPTLRQRFVQLETKLFALRFRDETEQARRQFVDSLDLAWEPVSDQERAQFRDQLAAIADTQQFFKLDFERVADLVETRRVFLYGGRAYVPQTLLERLVTSEFSARLMHGLEMTARALPRLDEDDRLIPILNHLGMGLPPQQAPVEDLKVGGKALTADMVDKLEADNHFPLCMRVMHRDLRHDGHAKYALRQYYGRFLKHIGLSVDESLRFWRQSFTKKTAEEFDKDYAYNIKYHYGLVGAGREYMSTSCHDIITNGNTSGCQGCPYKSFGEEALRRSLEELGIRDPQRLTEIEDDVKHQNYQVACTRVYDLTHPNRAQQTMTVPVQYFTYSIAALGQD